MMTIKPFCVKSIDLTASELNAMLIKCVEIGAETYDWVEGFCGVAPCHHKIDTLKYWGVDRNLDTATHNTAPCYGGNILTKTEAFEMLGIASQKHQLKPDWKDAPSWAGYLAMDINGAWYWYESRPSKKNRGEWVSSIGEGRIDEAYIPSDEWADSLESRPE